MSRDDSKLPFRQIEVKEISNEIQTVTAAARISIVRPCTTHTASLLNDDEIVTIMTANQVYSGTNAFGNISKVYMEIDCSRSYQRYQTL
jgi:hypothetical protein